MGQSKVKISENNQTCQNYRVSAETKSSGAVAERTLRRIEGRQKVRSVFLYMLVRTLSTGSQRDYLENWRIQLLPIVKSQLDNSKLAACTCPACITTAMSFDAMVLHLLVVQQRKNLKELCVAKDLTLVKDLHTMTYSNGQLCKAENCSLCFVIRQSNGDAYRDYITWKCLDR